MLDRTKYRIVLVGLTEKQIAKEIDDFFIDNGAEDVAFSTIVASGKNSSMPHAVPTNKKIQRILFRYDKNDICRICTRRSKTSI